MQPRTILQESWNPIMKIKLLSNFRQLRTLIIFVFLLVLFAAGRSLSSPSTSTAKTPGATVPAVKTGAAATSKMSAAKSSKPQRKKGDRELLWKLTSESGATLYLLGTVHVFKPQDYPLPEEMEKAFARAHALIVEVDVTKTDAKFTQTFVGQHGIYPPSDALSQHLSGDSRKLLQEYCLKRNLPFNGLNRMRPWIVAITVLQKELELLGYSPAAGIDVHFLNEANNLGKKVISLETLEFQLNLFANLPDDLQEMDLALSLVDLSKLPTDAGQMMKAWMTGDAEAMDDVMTKDIKEHPELSPVQERLLYERNITMAQKLEAYLKGGQDIYLAAIGSGHLVGNRSVISLLTKRGYKATQVLVGDDI